jgi:hypothetical protein
VCGWPSQSSQDRSCSRCSPPERVALPASNRIPSHVGLGSGSRVRPSMKISRCTRSSNSMTTSVGVCTMRHSGIWSSGMRPHRQCIAFPCCLAELELPLLIDRVAHGARRPASDPRRCCCRDDRRRRFPNAGEVGLPSAVRGAALARFGVPSARRACRRRQFEPLCASVALR